MHGFIENKILVLCTYTSRCPPNKSRQVIWICMEQQLQLIAPDAIASYTQLVSLSVSIVVNKILVLCTYTSRCPPNKSRQVIWICMEQQLQLIAPDAIASYTQLVSLSVSIVVK